MSLLNRIKTVHLEARKARNNTITLVLGSLISEAAMVGKNNGNRESTDAEVIATIKKFIANMQETLKVVNNEAQIKQITAEIAAISQFLPAQLTEAELIVAIEKAVSDVGATSIKEMGKVMKVLKERHDGAFDGAQASAIVKQKLGA